MVCLVDEASGIPFVASLRVRHFLPDSKYEQINSEFSTYTNLPKTADPQLNNLMTLINQPNPHIVARQKLIDILEKDGLWGAWEEVIALESRTLDPLNIDPNSIMVRKAAVSTTLRDIAERHGQHETEAMLIRQMKRALKALNWRHDPEALSSDRRGESPIDQEYYELHRQNTYWPKFQDTVNKYNKVSELNREFQSMSTNPEGELAFSQLGQFMDGMMDNLYEMIPGVQQLSGSIPPPAPDLNMQRALDLETYIRQRRSHR